MHPNSLYLARLAGPVGVIVGLGIVLNAAGYAAIATDFLKSPALMYLGAVLGLVGGVALVLAHNLWVWDWRLIITLLGWISIVDSASWILLPQPVGAFWTPYMTSGAVPVIAGAITLILGAVLVYFGYFDRPAPRVRRRGRK